MADGKKPWTIKQLYDAMQEDLKRESCGCIRANIEAVCGKEIREKAYEWEKIRKLTPGEVAIASKYGYGRRP